MLTVDAPRSAGAAPDLDQRKATGSSAASSPGTCPAPRRADGATGCTGRAAGGLAVDAEAITGGSVVPLTLRPGRAAGRRARRLAAPRLEGYEALRLDRARPPAGRRDPHAASSPSRRTTTSGGCVDATGVQIPGVLDDLYADAADRDLGVTLARPHARRCPLWAPTAQDVDLLVWRRPARRADSAGPDAARWRRRLVGDRRVAWNGARLPLRGRWSTCRRTGEVETNPVTDPYSRGADDELGAVGGRRPRRPGAAARRAGRTPHKPRARPARGLAPSTSCTSATSRSATRPCRPRTAAPTWRSPTTTATACSTCGRSPTPGSTPCTCCRPSTSPRSRSAAAEQATPACDLASFAPGLARSSRPASTAVARHGRLQLGLRPVALHGAGGLLRHRSARAPRPHACEFRTMVAGPQRRRPAGRHGRGLQPHRRRRARTRSRVLDRIVPGYYHRLDATGAVETSTCCAEHRHRARDDGEADGRLGASRGRGTTRSTASGST